MSKYGIPETVMMRAIALLDNMEPELLISPYADYHCLKDLQCPKFPVTASVRSIHEGSQLQPLHYYLPTIRHRLPISVSVRAAA